MERLHSNRIVRMPTDSRRLHESRLIRVLRFPKDTIQIELPLLYRALIVGRSTVLSHDACLRNHAYCKQRAMGVRRNNLQVCIPACTAHG